jgi:hypothetical protein
MDFLSLNEYLQHVRHEIKHTQERIAEMERGDIKVRRRFIAGGDWADVTAQEIGREKQLIAVLESILARHPGGPQS